MKNTGIWMDKDRALIVTIKDGVESLKTVASNMEHYNPHGGSGTRFKGGPQDVVQDSKFLEREKHQFKKYFNDVVSEISDANALVIFGPAGTNERFNKELSENHKALAAKVKAVEKADSMTDNQVIALVREFFN